MNMEQSSISSGTEFSTTVDDISTDSLESKQPKTFDQSSYSSVTKSAPDITNSLSDHFQVILWLSKIINSIWDFSDLNTCVADC